MKPIVALWRDERGNSALPSLILITTIVALGCITGLVTLRDHIVQQYGDLSVALDYLDQSYRYQTGVDNNGDGDFTDPGECEFSGGFRDLTTLVDPVSDAPACLNMTIAPADE